MENIKQGCCRALLCSMALSCNYSKLKGAALGASRPLISCKYLGLYSMPRLKLLYPLSGLSILLLGVKQESFPFVDQDQRSKVNTSLQTRACSYIASLGLLNCPQSCWPGIYIFWHSMKYGSAFSLQEYTIWFCIYSQKEVCCVSFFFSFLFSGNCFRGLWMNLVSL